MGITDFLTREDNAWDINTGTYDTPVWTPIGGLNNWDYSPETVRADTTKKSGNGWRGHIVAGRGAEHTLSGLKQIDKATGDRDPGQLAVEQLALAMGTDAFAQFRHTAGGSVVNVFEASIEGTWGTGGTDDASPWEVTLVMNGEPSYTGTPDLPSIVTSVTGTGGTGSVSVTWTDGAEVGSLFEVRIYNGSTLLKTVFGSDKPILVSGLDAGAGRTAVVRAQNATGWGPLSSPSGTFTIS